MKYNGKQGYKVPSSSSAYVKACGEIIRKEPKPKKAQGGDLRAKSK